MAIENKTLMETLIDAGYPREEMYHHCSDLYIFWTPTTIQIVDRWYKERGLNRALFVKQFKDQITGRLMLACVFQYDVYWDEVAKRKGGDKRMPYQRKTRDVWKLMVNYGYGHGWEHELTEFTIAEARQRLKEYRENCPQYPARIVMAREKIEKDKN